MPQYPQTPTPKIKLCYFCSLDSFDTGMPISTYKLIEHFANHPDFQVFVVVPGQGELFRRIRQWGIEPCSIPFGRLRSPKRFRAFIGFIITYPLSFLRIASFLQKNKIALVHFSDIIDAPFYPCARLANAKVVAHLRHCIENPTARFLFSRFAALFTHKVICISKAVHRYSGIIGLRAEVIYNPGPDLTRFDPQKKYTPPPGLPHNRAIVLSIGKFLRVKGHEHFVRMAHAVERSRPGISHFAIVGSTQPDREEYYQEVKKLIASLNLESVVTILNHIPYEQIPAVLACSSVFVHAPNWLEGLGGVVLEAMAMEVPVVAFNSGGVSECFTHELSGFLVAQFDVAAAATRIIELLDNTIVRKKMGCHARKELLSKFSYKNHFSAIESTYRTIFHV
ncbi:MAG TPA: glycosyltransferase family 4 protein [Chitinivibrionales bacterium]